MFLLLAGLGVYQSVLVSGEVFFFRDLYIYFVPEKARVVENLWNGVLPFWNRELHGGVPLLADISQSLFYPPHLLYLFIPAYDALSWLVVAHVVASSIGAFLLARDLGLASAPAAAVGLVYAYCGPSLSSTNLVIRLYGVTWIPLLVLGVRRALVHRRPSGWVLAGVSGLLLALAGVPEMLLFGLGTVLLWSWVETGAGGRLRATAAWCALTLALAGASACQLVPLLHLVGDTARGEGISYDAFTGFSLPPERLPELVVAGFFGRTDTVRDQDYWGAEKISGRFPYLVSIYLGVAAAGFAVGGLFVSRGPVPRGVTRLCGVLVLASVVLCLGRHLPGFRWAWEWVPGVGLFRGPIKLMGLLALPWAILVGVGVDGCGDARVRRIAWAVWLSIGGACGLVAPGLVDGWSRGLPELFFGPRGSAAAAEVSAVLLSTAALAGVAALSLGLVAVAGRHANGRYGSLALWAVVVTIGVDLVHAGRSAQPTTDPAVIGSEPAAVSRLRPVVGDGRLYSAARPLGYGLELPSNDIVWFYRWNQETLKSYAAAAWGLPVIFHPDFTALAPTRITKMGEVVEALDWPRKLPLLAAAGVRVVVTPHELEIPGLEPLGTIGPPSPPIRAYRVRDAVPTTRLVHLWVGVDEGERALRSMLSPGYDPARHAVLDGDVETMPRPVDDSRGCGGEVEILEADSNGRRVRVATDCPAILVFADTWNAGWRARVDGLEAEVHRVDFAFAGVFLEPGDHRIDWRYSPPGLGSGVALSLGTLFLCGVVGRRRFHGRPGGSPEHAE